MARNQQDLSWVQDSNQTHRFLVKTINESFDVDSFLSSPITNYKVLASIYKIFEAKSVENYDVKDIFNSKITLIENITSKPATQKREEKKQLVEEYRKQDQDIRLLTYKILVETFNKKYSNLNKEQKSLLREYINNVNNTSKFKDYISKEIPNVVSELKTISKNIGDKVTTIKLNETIAVLETTKIGKVVTDKHVSSVMIAYELIKELKTRIK